MAPHSLLTVMINGQAQAVAPGSSLASVLAPLLETGKRLAVERNGAIVPRSAYAQTVLQAGDQLEIVTAVGGG